MTDMLNLNITMDGLEEILDSSFGERNPHEELNLLDISYTGLTYKTLKQIDPKVKTFAVLNNRIITNPPRPYDILENDVSSVNLMTFTFRKVPFVYVQLRSQIAYDLCREYIFYRSKDLMINALCQAIADLNRTGKTMAVYDGDDIAIEELAKVPYVVPSKLIAKWSQFVEPQLTSKETYDNVLFYGDPGTGKTAFLRWAATKYHDWKFILVQPQVVTKVGVVTDIYKFAKKRVPAVVIFEDIDLIGQNRQMESGNFTHVLGELLNNLDGMDPNHKVLTVASTNNPGALDPAVRRAGRLGIPLQIEYTPDEIVKILRMYYPFPTLTDDEMLEVVGGKRTPADLRAVAKVCEVYEKRQGRKMTAMLLQSTLNSIGKEKKFDVPPPEANM